MSDRRDRDRGDRDRDRDRDRRRRSRSPRDRDRRDRRERDRSRSPKDRDRERRERRDRDRDRERDKDEDKKEEAKKPAEGEVHSDKLTGIAAQLEEETRKRRERVEEWRRARERHEARLQEAKDQLELETETHNGHSEPQEGVLVDENEDVDEEDSESEENSDDELDDMDVDNNNGVTQASDGDDEDPLDAYMASLAESDKKAKKDDKPATRRVVISEADKTTDGPAKGDIIDNEEEPARIIEDFDMGEEMKTLMARSKHLQETDHTKVYYKEFRKDFYHEVPDLQRMTKKEVDEYRKSLDNISVRGKKPPKPIKNWAQAGLQTKVMNVLKKLNYQKPTPIQAQAVPAILSGRDVIGIAKTGSGKTLAFLLPMFRHIMDQDPLDEMDGPIAIVMSPTRELALQTYKEAKKFAKALELQVVCVYGGVGISDQIADLKKGAEIIVCTPGRMIDMLAANGGKVTNLRRVTYLVMDEADRMFDMGFEPQVMKIVNNIRPDRQTVLFSATFPKRMEALARKVLREPVEIQVGGKSVVCGDVDQHALVVDEHIKLLKLLELLGQYYELGSVLVFVEKQEKADELVSELMGAGYNCAPLHGGIDQFDRDSTIIDYKSGRLKILVGFFEKIFFGLR
uniref:RNA helicase n=1 Tax=Bursaphelenchus xylophilus TaxID=6326 RepID=A0A1I7S5B8_BURXY